jgi:hypothetical protein
MAIDPQLAAMMTQRAYAYAPAGVDAYGHTSFSPTPLELPCHIRGRIQELVDKNGEAVVSTGNAILTDVYPGLNEQWSLLIPDPSVATGTTPGQRRVNIIAVITRYDEVGESHQVIYYGERGSNSGSGSQ